MRRWRALNGKAPSPRSLSERRVLLLTCLSAGRLPQAPFGSYTRGVTVCGQCGHENLPDNRFCGRCGAVLEAAAAPREVRKTVTVVFCDLTGSTALGES